MSSNDKITEFMAERETLKRRVNNLVNLLTHVRLCSPHEGGAMLTIRLNEIEGTTIRTQLASVIEDNLVQQQLKLKRMDDQAKKIIEMLGEES